MRERFAGVMERVRPLVTWVQSLRVVRALRRYSQANGGVLAGGVAYSALFSLFAMLSLAYMVFMTVLGGNPELRDSVFDTISQALPGLLDTGDGGALQLKDLELTGTSGPWGEIIAIVVLLVSAPACLSALRTSVLAMFGAPEAGGNAIIIKLREYGSLVALGLLVLASSAAGIVLTRFTDWITELLGVSNAAATAIWLQVAGFAISFILDGAAFALIIVVLAGIRPPRRDLLGAMAMGAVAAGVLRYGSTALIGGAATKNALVASFATVVTLLVWINLVVRVVLMIAAWAADPPAEPAKAVVSAGPNRSARRHHTASGRTPVAGTTVSTRPTFRRSAMVGPASVGPPTGSARLVGLLHLSRRRRTPLRPARRPRVSRPGHDA